MSDEFIFKSRKGNIMRRGKGDSQGILYCGKKFTSHGGCQCLGCDGYCGPDSGCACPDCDYTLAYILYSTGEMICPKCQSMLIRLNIYNLKNLTNIVSFLCNICFKNYFNNHLPIMHCMACNYNICPKCAFAKINIQKLKPFSDLLYNGHSGGEGMLYCGKKYTLNHKCICGSCDGNCGKYNGCPCPLCDIIQSYNLHINYNLKCSRCKETLLIKMTIIQLKKYKKGYINGFICDICHQLYNSNFRSVFHCYKCDFDLCQVCSYNLIKNKPILLPLFPQRNFTKSNNDVINALQKHFKKMTIHEENKEIKNKSTPPTTETGNGNMKCVICLEKDKCFLFLPCRHVSCCEDCSNKVNQCPICRNRIDSKLKIFL